MSKLLDAWHGETVLRGGRRYFEVEGKLVPAEESATRMRRNLLERFQAGVRAFQDRPVDRVARWLRDQADAARAGRVPMKFQPMMGTQGWSELLDGTIADGAQISNTTTETILAPDFSIPGYWMTPGRVLRLWAFGVNSNVVTTPGTLTFRVRWGGVSGVALLVSAALGLDTTARTNALWLLDARIICRTAGATGTFMSGGYANVVNVLASTGISNNGVFSALTAVLGSAGTPIASGNAAVTVDTTVAKLLSITAAFSVATSPTNLTCQQRLIEALN